MIRRSFSFFAALCCAVASDAQALVEHHLFTGMDGVHLTAGGGEIPIWGYGWAEDEFITLPAPLLSCMQGDSVRVQMDNPSPESHTIHWHGLDVNQANDGVPSTSFLVPTDSSATYAFLADHSGTYLYHCHVTTTLHLTMGMYGMFIVERPDGSLFEGGPVPDAAFPLLFSDLELAVNFNPPGAFPFHDIRPNYFMINGRNGAQLEAPEAQMPYNPGETIALRLGSMAYSRIDVALPSVLGAEVVMSDGRPVEPWSPDTLSIYPGERFTVVFEVPASGWNDEIACDFVMMADNLYEQTQTLHFNNLQSSVSQAPVPQAVLSPNPTRGMLNIVLPKGWQGPWALCDLAGRQVRQGVVGEGQTQLHLDLSGEPVGTYLFRGINGLQSRVILVPER